MFKVAEEDASEVSCAEVADEFEVFEVELVVGGEVGDGFNGGPMWV